MELYTARLGMREKAAVQRALLIGSASLVCASVAGCVFFTVPEKAGMETATTRISWLRPNRFNAFSREQLDSELKGLKRQGYPDRVEPSLGGRAVIPVCSAEPGKPPCCPKPKWPLSGCGELKTTVSAFVHLSDAQICDEQSYDDANDQEALEFFDFFQDVTSRRGLVEANDSLVFAAFLFAANRDAGTRPAIDPPPFVIHTGDLLDISLASELREAMNVASAPQLSIPFYSVGGNHDGLTFGNIADTHSDTRSLGINNTEFVLGHLLSDEDGYGFARNEILSSASITSCQPTERHDAVWWNKARRWLGKIRETQETIGRYRRGKLDQTTLEEPLVFRDAIKVGGPGDKLGLHLGYYSWQEAAPDRFRNFADLSGLRYIVLDTRSVWYQSGQLDLVQLGWLYNEVSEAMRWHEGVVLFAHHAPSSFETFYNSRETRIFRRILDQFPNIVGYFFGHGHVNHESSWTPVPKRIRRQRRFALVQTGSLADFPQVGRRVNISAEDAAPGSPCEGGIEANIDWAFVRPDVEKSDPTGIRLAAVLKASQKDSEKEMRASARSRKFFHYATGGLVGKFAEFDDDAYESEFLRPGFQRVCFAVQGEVPSPASIFGGALAETNSMRECLSLPPTLGCGGESVRCSAHGSASPPWPEVPRGNEQVSELLEASAVAVIAGAAIVASDEAEDKLWGIDLNGRQSRWTIEFPADTPDLNDIEGMAPMGYRTLYAVTSQSRNKKGEAKPSRSRLARIAISADARHVERVEVFEDLRTPLVAHLRGSGALTDLSDADHLNVEGLAWWRGQLLIGLRQPFSTKGAIVVPILNVDSLFAGGDGPVAPAFGEPLFVSARRGEGIRALTELANGNLLVVLGPGADDDVDAPGGFRLVRWDPSANDDGASTTIDAQDWDLSDSPRSEGIALDGRDRLVVANDLQKADSRMVQVIPRAAGGVPPRKRVGQERIC
jgi:3',5'-cyclic AMP phosphodiesterase CpdA